MALMSEDKRVFFSGSAIIVNDETASRAEAEADRAAREADRAEAAAADAEKYSFASRPLLVSFVATSPSLVNGTELRAEGLSYVWRSGAASIPDMPNVLPLLFTSPEHYGAIGNGSSDDVVQIQAMFDGISVSGVRVVWFNPNKEYGIGAPILTNNSFQCFTRMRFVGLGTRPTYADTLVNLNARVCISSIEIRLASGAVWQRVLRPGRGYFGQIIITSPAVITDWPDAAGAAVTFSFDHDTEVGIIRVVNFDRGVTVRNTNRIKIGQLDTISCLRGIRLIDTTYVSIGQHTHNGRIITDLSLMGLYAQDIENSKYFRCDYAFVDKAMGHGIRVSGQSDYASQFLSWGTAIIDAPGRCGFKLQGATNEGGDAGSLTWIGDVTIDNLIVYDAGRLADEYLVANGGVGEFSDNGLGTAGGANEYSLSLVQSTRVHIANFVSAKKNNVYAGGSAGISIRSSNNIRIPSADISDAYYYGIKLGAAEQPLQNIHVDGKIVRIGTFSDNTTGGNPITSLNSRGFGIWALPSVTSMRDVVFEFDIINSRRGVYHRATSFPEPSVLKGNIIRCFSGVDDNSPGSNQYLNLTTVNNPRA